MMIEGLRNFAMERKKTTVALAAAPLVLVLLFFSTQLLPASGPDWPMAYYFDEANGEITTRPASDFPPLKGSSGKPTVVKAIYLTPSNADQKFLAYLEKYSDETAAKMRQQVAASNAPSPIGINSGILVRLPAPNAPWLEAGSPEGQKLLNGLYRPDPNGPPLRQCPP